MRLDDVLLGLRIVFLVLLFLLFSVFVLLGMFLQFLPSFALSGCCWRLFDGFNEAFFGKKKKKNTATTTTKTFSY